MARIYRLHKLWKAAGGPGLPPAVDTQRIKAKVSAALAAGQPGQSGQLEQPGQTERKMYFMKNMRNQRLGTAALAAVLLLVITGTAFAAFVNGDPFAPWFKGDTSPGQEYLDSEIRSVSDENFTLTVESSVADENSVYLVVSVTALNDEAGEILYRDDFTHPDLETMDDGLSVRTPSEYETGMFQVRGMGIGKLDSEMENCRRFSLAAQLISPADTVYVRCGWMEKGLCVEVPVASAPSVTVKIDASGMGADRRLDPGTPPFVGIGEITLTPFTCRMTNVAYIMADGVSPNIFLRMKDGAIRTQSQLMTGVDGTLLKDDGKFCYYEENYRFYEIQDLENISSVIAFDMEYPLDGSAPVPVEHDPSLDPFTVKRLERLSEGSGYSVPARELTEGLGGACVWDAARQEMTCTYRDAAIVLQIGSGTAFVNGEAVELPDAPREMDGSLAAPGGVFREAWGIGCYVRTKDVENADGERDIVWGDEWYVVP